MNNVLTDRYKIVNDCLGADLASGSEATTENSISFEEMVELFKAEKKLDTSAVTRRCYVNDPIQIITDIAETMFKNEDDEIEEEENARLDRDCIYLLLGGDGKRTGKNFLTTGLVVNVIANGQSSVEIPLALGDFGEKYEPYKELIAPVASQLKNFPKKEYLLLVGVHTRSNSAFVEI